MFFCLQKCQTGIFLNKGVDNNHRLDLISCWVWVLFQPLAGGGEVGNLVESLSLCLLQVFIWQHTVTVTVHIHSSTASIWKIHSCTYMCVKSIWIQCGNGQLTDQVCYLEVRMYIQHTVWLKECCWLIVLKLTFCFHEEQSVNRSARRYTDITHYYFKLKYFCLRT